MNSVDQFPDITSKSFQTLLSEKLSSIYEQYPDDIGITERKKLDLDLSGKGLLPEADIIKIYSEITGFKIVEEDELNDLEPFPKLSYEYLENYCCIPLSFNEEIINMIICDPYSIDNIVYLFKHQFNKKLVFSMGRRSIVERLIHTIYNRDDMENSEFGDIPGGIENEETLRTMASEAKIVRLVNEIFSRAVELEASDIHVEPEENKYVVRFRIDGILQEFISAPLSQYPAVASRIKLIGGLNIAENRLPQDGRTNIVLGKSEVDIRISTIPILNGESLVLRLLKKDSMDFSLQSTGMNENMIKIFENLIHQPHGIILVVGPTGSGKTTTLYSIMTQLNTPDKKIITIEDPVEYRIQRLSQMQVNSKIGLTFANGLRNIVRQDPDIILVGEIRDKETADIAINAALTGHLVLSTLHTNDAAGAISRLEDMGSEGFLISSSLIGILSQRLIRTVCIRCKGKGIDNNSHKCKNCTGTGYKGRTGIFELLIVNDQIREAILNNSDSSTINSIAVTNGMIPLLEDGLMQAKKGITTESEVHRAASNI